MRSTYLLEQLISWNEFDNTILNAADVALLFV